MKKNALQTTRSALQWVFALLCVSLVLFTGNTWAWNAAGHQTVGAIADELIQDTRAQQEVRRLLGGLSLKTVSVWPDCAKGVASTDDRSFIYTANNNAFPECAAFGGGDWDTRFVNYVRANWKQCGKAHGSEHCHNQYHYADISTFQSAYASDKVGANDWDVVHAITAAIAVLRNQAPPAPFVIPSKLEALMLLTHFVGDIHQPLHIESIYLDQQGNAIDPDKLGEVGLSDTAGGNLIKDGNRNFHAFWDEIPQDMVFGGPQFPLLLDAARKTAATSGDALQWSAQWASDTVVVGQEAYKGLSFAPDPTSNLNPPRWLATRVDPQYESHAASIKLQQVAKAGARLAQVLRAIWPDDTACIDSDPQASGGYLSPQNLPDVLTIVPPVPKPDSAQQAADDKAFFDTRADVPMPRGIVAALDDVWVPNDLLPRFSATLGANLNPSNAPTLFTLIAKAQTDAGNVVLPLKKNLCGGGRVRPFVAHPAAPSCLSLLGQDNKLLVGHWQPDINRFHLDQTGSYPSTHALLGELVGAILADIAPERAALVRRRGLDFGDSRLICGFHYPSDIAAGRLAADALFTKLKADGDFQKDLKAAKAELDKVMGR